MPRVLGDRIMLREYRREDLPFIRAWVNDPDITNTLSDVFAYPHSEERTQSFLDSMLKGGGDLKSFVIADRRTEAYIGQIDLIRIDWKSRWSSIAIVIGDKKQHGKGYGSEALKLLQRFAFEELNLNRLQLEVYDYNVAGYRCYLKSGFCEEGRLRQRHYHQGRYCDLIEMGILRSEYEEQAGR
ncbi:GNAT family N-acetyltransferase [Saccharibacillus sp. O16]|nr:GNAT family N-acetyltransferase [Saccharibacillus sp. O16]